MPLPQTEGGCPERYTMKLKTVDVGGKTYAEINDGKPVYIEDDGKEVAFDAPATKATISRINGEAKGHREAKEAAEVKLKAFEGITDPAAAVKALETIKNIDDKKLIDAGQVEQLKRDISKSFEDKISSLEKNHATALSQATDEKAKLEKAWHTEKRTNAFASSKTIADKFTIPSDFVEARFANNFKVEDGKLVGYDNGGNKIYSRARPAELATFDEAIESLVDAYPAKDTILKGRGGGSGAGNGNGKAGAGKTITRAEYDANPAANASKLSQGYTLVD